MSWKYRQADNSFGMNQVFDYSQCPPVAVCKDCHEPYTNYGDGLSCRDCVGSSDTPVEETGQSTEQITNEFGFCDFVLLENGERQLYPGGKPITVCPQCLAMTMPNRGGGCLCDSCDHEFTIECEHDHHDDIAVF